MSNGCSEASLSQELARTEGKGSPLEVLMVMSRLLLERKNFFLEGVDEGSE